MVLIHPSVIKAMTDLPMTLTCHTTSDDCKVWILQPNRSATWRQACFFFGGLSLLCLLIAVAFSLLGAWLILPFAGLEVLVLFTAVWLVHHHLMNQEVITLRKDYLILESGVRKEVKQEK